MGVRDPGYRVDRLPFPIFPEQGTTGRSYGVRGGKRIGTVELGRLSCPLPSLGSQMSVLPGKRDDSTPTPNPGEVRHGRGPDTW